MMLRLVALCLLALAACNALAGNDRIVLVDAGGDAGNGGAAGAEDTGGAGG